MLVLPIGFRLMAYVSGLCGSPAVFGLSSSSQKSMSVQVEPFSTQEHGSPSVVMPRKCYIVQDCEARRTDSLASASVYKSCNIALSSTISTHLAHQPYHCNSNSVKLFIPQSLPLSSTNQNIPTMSPVEIHLIDLSVAAKQIPADKPVVMINLLKFKAVTTYPEGSPHSPCSGEEAYLTRYVTAFSKFNESVNPDEPNYKVLWLGRPQANMVAPPSGGKEIWDRVGIIWYPNFATFTRWVGSKEYQEGPLIHRLAALEDYRLYATTE